MKFSLLLSVLWLAVLCACQRADVQPTSSAQFNRDEKIILNYLDSTGARGYIRTPNGVYVLIDSVRPEGIQLRRGLTAWVKYRGYRPTLYYPAFDSTSVNINRPFRVEIGTTNVISGWTEGLPFFKNGEVGRLLIPSRLGYGTSGAGSIASNQVLIFNIKVVSVQ